MQGSGNDLVHCTGEISPVDMAIDELEKRFNNDDAIILWHDQLYYAKRGHPPATLNPLTIVTVIMILR